MTCFVRTHSLAFECIICTTAEPNETLLRIAVAVGSQEIAYETCVLAGLRRGYRVFRLRSALGTRIELCYVFVKISFSLETNGIRSLTQWPSRTALDQAGRGSHNSHKSMSNSNNMRRESQRSKRESQKSTRESYNSMRASTHSMRTI